MSSKCIPNIYPKVSTIQMPVLCMDISKSARLVAIGCSAQLKIVKVDNSNCVSDFANFTSLPVNSTITDLSWSKIDAGKLAASFSNGSVISFVVGDQLSKQSTNIIQEWNSGKVSSCVNKVAWHSFDKNILASANQDGLVKMYDFRYSNNPCQMTTYGHKSNIAIRDVAFDPFHSDIFAEVSDSGNLKLWDRRYLDKPFMIKHSAHSQPILTVAWHPSLEYVLATGSRDRSIKVWDYSVCSVDGTPHSSNASSEPLCTQTVHTSSAVGRVLWRGGDDVYRNQLASIAAHSTPGHTFDPCAAVSIWDLSHSNIPVCVLKGHDSSECCVDFAWIDSLANSGLALDSGSNSANSSGGYAPSKTNKKQNSKSSNFSNYQRTLEVQQLKAQQQAVTQYIFSIGSNKDGSTMMIQDLRCGSSRPDTVVYPYDHISPSVVAISSQGDAAFHRGFIDPVVKSSAAGGMPAILVSSSSGSGFSHNGSAKEVSKTQGRSRSNSSSGMTAPIVHRPRSSSFKDVDALHTGVVVLGLADIHNLEECEGIRKERGAEGGVFDPALILLLARSYSLAHTLYGSEEATTRLREGSCSSTSGFASLTAEINERTDLTSSSKVKDNNEEVQQLKRDKEAQQVLLNEYTLKKMHYDDAIEACRTNLNVALAAGLKCRASVWSCIMTLLPVPLVPKVTPQKPVETNSRGKSRESSSTNLVDLLYPNSFKSNNTTASNTPTTAIDVPLVDLSRPTRGDLPFGIEVIASLLSELLEGGDCQHFVVMCEILRKAGLLDTVCTQGKITEFRMRRTYLAYLDLLIKLQLFCEANEIIKASADSYISSLSKQGVEIHTRCGKCGKELTEKSSTAWCLKCARCVCMCVLCNKPVRGLLHWCPVCGHGGHLECTKKWFSMFNTCPSGCGHDCCSSMMSEFCQDSDKSGIDRSGKSQSHSESSTRHHRGNLSVTSVAFGVDSGNGTPLSISPSPSQRTPLRNKLCR